MTPPVLLMFGGVWMPCAAMLASALLVVGCCCVPVAACSDVGMQSDRLCRSGALEFSINNMLLAACP